MSSYTHLIPWGAVLVLAVGGAAAQSTAPPATTPPETLGVTPAEAAEATRQAVPSSDTGTVVRTAPSPAERMDTPNGTGTNGTGTNGTGRSATGTLDTDATTGAGTGAGGVTSDGSTPTMRSPRIDRN